MLGSLIDNKVCNIFDSFILVSSQSIKTVGDRPQLRYASAIDTAPVRDSAPVHKQHIFLLRPRADLWFSPTLYT